MKIEPALERCAGQIKKFVEQGGIILVYGPFYRSMTDTYDYPWLPARFTYRYLPRMQKMKVAMPESPHRRFRKARHRGLRRIFRTNMRAMSC